MMKEVVPKIYNPESVRIRIENVYLRLDTVTGELSGAGELIARGRPELPADLEPEVCCVVRDRKGRILHECESTHLGSFLNSGRYGYAVFRISIPGYSQLCSSCWGASVELFLIMKEKGTACRNCVCCRQQGCTRTGLSA
ncbi:MAG: hypothetical protein MR966_01325 [Lachnospiraceae bacterium]|nr:hypothetical protein [Lachnospiraceae bacterium]